MKLIETNLNLRIEKGLTANDYVLSEKIGERQLDLEGDIYANVEFMDCINEGYHRLFALAGFQEYRMTDEKGRGILCEIRKEYDAEVQFQMEDPHLLHLRIKEKENFIDLITIRILVGKGDEADYKDRREQWMRVLAYLRSLKDCSHVVLNGDFNHGVIRDDPRQYRSRPRSYYNYQMIVEELALLHLDLIPMEGMSYKGYMKVDHVFVGSQIKVREAFYEELFKGITQIGVPDHSCMLVGLEMK